MEMEVKEDLNCNEDKSPDKAKSRKKRKKKSFWSRFSFKASVFLIFLIQTWLKFFEPGSKLKCWALIESLKLFDP